MSFYAQVTAGLMGCATVMAVISLGVHALVFAGRNSAGADVDGD